jgi:hypothetical protein
MSPMIRCGLRLLALIIRTTSALNSPRHQVHGGGDQALVMRSVESADKPWRRHPKVRDDH